MKVHVYTGDGKGKTTAAVGAGLRAVGHGWRVHAVQFMKGPPFPEYGEVAAIDDTDGFTLEQFPTKHFVTEDDVRDEDVEAVEDAMEASRQAIAGDYDMVILDEVNVACGFGLVSADEVLELLDADSETVVVLTGRYAPDEVVEAADLVTRMEKVKHPYDDGEDPKEGIEW